MQFSEFESEARKLLEHTPKCRSRNCFRSAILHLEKAAKLVEIDPEMSAFRSITAEEEAASGILYCLKELNYPDSDKFNPRQHPQKAAVISFFSAVSLMPYDLQKNHGFEFDLQIDTKAAEPKLVLNIRNTHLFPNHVITSHPPLHFAASTGNKLRSFTPYIDELISKAGATTFIEHVKNQANMRNNLLYANEIGIPIVERLDSTFSIRKHKFVFALLYTYLLIKPYSEHQLFPCQLIPALLYNLEKMPIGDLHPDA